MKISGIFIVLATALLMGCGSSKQNIENDNNRTSGIIGGVLVPASSPVSKSVVGIYDDNEGFTCTGSLLPNNLVVTAAHCIGEKADGVFIVFAPDMETLLNSGKNFPTSPFVRRVIALKAHEKWTTEVQPSEPGNDIGLMKYEGTTPEGYVPATLLQDASLIKVGATAVLAGYGVSSDKVVPVSPKTPGLQKLIDQHEVFCDSEDAKKAKRCIKELLDGPAVLKATQVQITEIANDAEVILDEAHGHAACSGDSGGPAYIKVGDQYQLFGATSRSGLGCNKDIVYTNVLTYQTWIRDTAASF